MAQDFAEKLIHLSDRRFRANARAELGLDHGERRLDVRPAVVVRQELVAAIHPEEIHPAPQLRARPLALRIEGNRVRLEWDERERAGAVDRDHVGAGKVRFVGGEHIDAETAPQARFEERR